MARSILHHHARSFEHGEEEEEELTREIALEWQDSRIIAVCPRNYEDVLEEVHEIFDLPPGQVSLYTDSISSCPGKEFLITPQAWEGFWRKLFIPHVLVKVDIAGELSFTRAGSRYHTPEVYPAVVPEKPEVPTPSRHIPRVADSNRNTSRGPVSEAYENTLFLDETNSTHQEGTEEELQVMKQLDLNIVQPTTSPPVDSKPRKGGDKIQINVSGPKGQRKAIKIRPHKTIRSVVTILLEVWNLREEDGWKLYIVPYAQDQCGNLEAAGKIPCQPDESLERVGGAYDRCEFVLEARN